MNKISMLLYLEVNAFFILKERQEPEKQTSVLFR